MNLFVILFYLLSFVVFRLFLPVFLHIRSARVQKNKRDIRSAILARRPTSLLRGLRFIHPRPCNSHTILVLSLHAQYFNCKLCIFPSPIGSAKLQIILKKTSTVLEFLIYLCYDIFIIRIGAT